MYRKQHVLWNGYLAGHNTLCVRWPTEPPHSLGYVVTYESIQGLLCFNAELASSPGWDRILVVWIPSRVQNCNIAKNQQGGRRYFLHGDTERIRPINGIIVL